MYYIIYNSTAACDITEADLSQIIGAAERNNKRDNITGMLIYHDGSFIQMLEGDKQGEVEATYKRIAQDPRHHQPTMLFCGDTSKRHFPDWKMAIEVVDKPTFEKFQSYESLKEGNSFLSEIKDEHIGIKMLRYFYELKSK